MSVVFPINPDDRFEEYTATAAQTVFAVPFPFQDDRDLTVKKIAVVDGAITTLTLTTHYALSGAGTPGPGSMTLVTGAVAGDKFQLIGEAVLDRLTSIVRDGRYSSLAQDDEHDRHRLIHQELKRDLARSVKMPYGVPGPELAPLEAGRLIIVNDAGDALEMGPNAADIADAQSNAEVATAAKDDAETAQGIAEEARDEAVAAALIAKGVPIAATRTALAAISTAVYEAAILTERGRSGLFVPVLASSLSADEQLDAAIDAAAGQADYVPDGTYYWVRKTGKAKSVQKYGAHPDETAANNVIAINRALAREPYLLFDAETESDGTPKPYLINAGIVSQREGQIIEGEGFNSIIKASASITGPMIKTDTERFQQLRDIHVDGNSLATVGVQLDFPKNILVSSKVTGCTTAGVEMTYFSQSIGDGCYIQDNPGCGIIVRDGTGTGEFSGQVNDIRLGGGRLSSCSGNGQHGMLFTASNRDGFWINDWNMENNNTALSGYAHVAFNCNVDGIHIERMYHETDQNDAAALFYRFYSSSVGVALRSIKMNSSSPSTPPVNHIHICYTGGTIAEKYFLDDIWSAGSSSYAIRNDATAGGNNYIYLGKNFYDSRGDAWRFNSNNAMFSPTMAAS